MIMKKFVLSIIAVIVGLGLCLLCKFVFEGMLDRNIVAVMIGGGASMFGLGISGVISEMHMRRHPKERELHEIEEADERNRMIRERAKAKSSDIIQWLLFGATLMSIAMDQSLWMTGILIALFMAKSVLDFIFMVRIEKEN
jgi:hypothetical protein